MITEAVFEEFWKPALVLLCAALLWVYVRIEDAHIAKLAGQVTTLTAERDAANDKVQAQNTAIDSLNRQGKDQQARIDALASAGTVQAEKVVTQWKTKVVQIPVPEDCSAAIAAGAANAASVARQFQTSTRSSPSGS